MKTGRFVVKPVAPGFYFLFFGRTGAGTIERSLKVKGQWEWTATGVGSLLGAPMTRQGRERTFADARRAARLAFG